MENNILFPSAAVLLLQKRDEAQPGPLNVSNLDVSKFSSFPISAPNLYHDNEELQRSEPTDNLLSSRSHDHAEPTHYDFCRSSSDNESSSWESDSYKEDKKRKHKKHKRKKKKKKKRSKEEEHYIEEYKRKTEFITDTSKPETIWLDETELDHTNGFRKDSRPDQSNFEFSSLYKNDIANFYPPINCQCLGMGKQQSIILYPKKKQKKKKCDVSTRYFNNLSTTKYEIVDNRFVNAVECEDFMPLVCNKNVKSETGCVTDVPSNDSLGTPCLQKNIYFSQKLSENPFDIEMWLAFVEHQDELTMGEHKETYVISSKAIIEKKSSILEKAMISNPLSIRLIIKYMILVREIWPHDRVNKQWKDILFRIPNRSILWHHYFLYLQSDILTMKLSSVINAYHSGFRMLIGIYNGTIKSHQLEENGEEELLLVFLQMVLFLWQAGHTEKAVCLLQCMVEFNDFCPVDLLSEDNHQKVIASFEMFFEVELPRFGAPEAHGWNDAVVNSKNTRNVPDLSPFSCPYTTSLEVDFDEELEKLRNNRSKKDIWLALESIRNANEFLPFQGKPDDCEDTERIILSDDVMFSIFRLTSPSLKFQTVLMYLFLLGVPMPVHFLNHKIYNCFSVYYVIKNATASCSCFCHNLVFNDYIKINSVLLDEEGRPNHKVITTVRTIISQYLGCILSEKYIRQISQLWFHFESFLFRYEFENSKNFDKKYGVGMKKFIKRLLKIPANRSCVNLWCMYALYEWKIGNTGDSKKIFCTALQMSHADKDDAILKVAKIIRILVDLHLDWKACDVKDSISYKTKARVLNVYLAFIDPNKLLQTSDEEIANPVSLLKVYSTIKSIYTSISDIIKRTNTKATDFLSCYLVFIYLFHGLTMLVEVSDEIINTFFYNDVILDLSDTLCYALLLMKCDKTSGAFKAYKHLLEKCFKVYPQNERFSVLFNSLKQHGLAGYNARRFYEGALQSCDDLRLWLYAIDYEEKQMRCVTYLPSNNMEMLQPGNNSQVMLEFTDTQTGIHNRIRCLYNTLLHKDTLKFKYCAEVWLRYLTFQLQYGSKKQATDTLYTALQNCPGAKDVYLFACKKFDGKFEEMLNLMDEKEVRVKLIIEELDILLET